MGFPGGSDGKEPACSAEDPGSILGREDPLEKGMATHSSIVAWRIPQIVKSMGSQRVGHDGATFTFTSLGDIEGLIPDHCSKAYSSMKRVA